MSGIEILAPVNITRVMRESEDRFNRPQSLLWFNRAGKPEVSDDELTMKHNSSIFAADIVTLDSEAFIRDTGNISFERYESTKVKHGAAMTETIMKLLRRIQGGFAMDNEYLQWENWVADRAADLRLGIEQRWEAMLNGMLADSFSYNRLGIKATGTFGMKSDLKFTVDTAHSDTSSTPLLDVVTALNYAADTYDEQYNRITCEYEWVANVVATTEFKNIYKVLQSNNSLNIPTEHLAVKAAVPLSYLGFLSAYFSAQLGWEITVEVSRGKYREFSPSTRLDPVKFHPHGLLLFTDSSDDGGSSGWDLGKGEVMEAVVGSMGGVQILGGNADWGSNFHGPISYATPTNPYANPPGMVVWGADAGAPRRLRDTCSARLKWTA